MGSSDQARVPVRDGRRVAVVAVALVLSMVVAACGSSKGGSSSGTAADALAELQVISTDVTVQSGPDGSAASATSGQGVSVGDTVATDQSGFAEVGFFDGSLTRIDHAARFTIVDLQDPGASEVVHTDLASGRSWNRIDKLSESETWETDTPVASATVRGTAFVSDCALATPDACRFAVVDGTVELGLPDGSKLSVQAGQEVTVVKDQPPPAPVTVGVPVLLADAWVARNVALDADDGKAPLETASAAPTDGQYLLTGTGDTCANGSLADNTLTVAGSTVAIEGGGGVLLATADLTEPMAQLQIDEAALGLATHPVIQLFLTVTGGGVVLLDQSPNGSSCYQYIGRRISPETGATVPPSSEHCDALQDQLIPLTSADGSTNPSIYDCVDGWAVGSAQSNGDEGTLVFKWNGSAWELPDRYPLCDQGVVPAELYMAGCQTN